MIYHYTDRLSAAEIQEDGVIRAQPITLYRDMAGQGPGFQTPPIVWLTTDPNIDGTVAAKLWSAGWPRSLVGDLYRFSVADTGIPFREFAETIPAEWWRWMILTGSMVGSHASQWRVSLEDVRWESVEVLGEDGWL